MKSLAFTVVIALGITGSVAQPARASNVTFDFGGTITGYTFDPGVITDPFSGAINPGVTPFSGSYTFDSSTPNSGTSTNATYHTTIPPSSAITTVLGHTFNALSSLDIAVVSNAYGVDACSGFCFNDRGSFELFLQSPVPVFASTALPTTSPPIAAFTSAHSFLLQEYDAAGNFELEIDGTITSLTAASSAVPEPAAWLLLVTGSAGVAARARRRRA